MSCFNKVELTIFRWRGKSGFEIHFIVFFFLLLFLFLERAFWPIKEANLLHCRDGKKWEEFSPDLIENSFFGFHGFQLSALYGVWRKLVLMSVCC